MRLENIMKSIILASSSPRRKELLEKIGLKFQTVSVDYVENLNYRINPLELARELSAGKARAAAVNHPESIIIAADTFVALDDDLLGKPHTEAEATRMLSQISGRELSVITGFTIMGMPQNKVISRAVETRVFIKQLTQKEITDYVKTGEPLDKAGAFAIQGLGSLIVKKIEGDFFNVVGLPVFTLAQDLREFGINILG